MSFVLANGLDPLVECLICGLWSTTRLCMSLAVNDIALLLAHCRLRSGASSSGSHEFGVELWYLTIGFNSFVLEGSCLFYSAKRGIGGAHHSCEWSRLPAHLKVRSTMVVFSVLRNGLVFAEVCPWRTVSQLANCLVTGDSCPSFSKLEVMAFEVLFHGLILRDVCGIAS